MLKSVMDKWRRLGRIGQAFILIALTFLVMHFLNAGVTVQMAAGLLTAIFGIALAYQIARRVARTAIWRLRNRLIVAYLFIAVVPIVLILTLVGWAGKGIIGQVAVYLVDTELTRRDRFLLNEVSTLVQLPLDNTETYPRRFRMRGNGLPGFRPDRQDTELVLEGEKQMRFPPESKLEVPQAWISGGDQHYSGLIVREDSGKPMLYEWAYAAHNGNRAVAVEPVTHELLASLVPNLGDVNYTPVMGHIQKSHVPAPANLFDFQVTGVVYPVNVRTWESPEDFYDLYRVPGAISR
jgi:sigma-B regulation protein RsbU (phosphoserine phosphatase)